MQSFAMVIANQGIGKKNNPNKNKNNLHPNKANWPSIPGY